MDFNVQRYLDPSFIDRCNPISPFPYHRNFITPGIGQIVRWNSPYVPIYSHSDYSNIQKKISIDNGDANKVIQQGSGEGEILPIENEKETPLSENETNLDDNNESEMDIAKYNSKKRKLLNNDTLFNSFQHPILIKTGKISLVKSEKQKKNDLKISKKEEKPKTKEVQHKFKFV